jgi:serine/threonine-protein kinase
MPDPKPTGASKTLPIHPDVVARELAQTRADVTPRAVTPPRIGHPPPRTPAGFVALPADNLSPADRYELIGEVARGGMGVLLRARDALVGREVVIKLLRHEYRGVATAERRFLREARVNGQLQHPGIVPVYDVGRFPDGRPFFTMRYVHGRTLDALLADRPHPAADRGRFLRLFEQVCQTVAYAHAKGVVHRDLKPLNVMASGFGQVRVLDWGLAKVLGERTPRSADPTMTIPMHGPPHDTAGGSAVGTPAYIAPEQAAGRHDAVDERSDVFGLGGILCEILTGGPPYAGRSVAEVWARATAGDLADAHARLAGCGADSHLIDLARRCLAADPADRPRAADEVAAAVAAPPRPGGLRAAVGRWLRRGG